MHSLKPSQAMLMIAETIAIREYPVTIRQACAILNIDKCVIERYLDLISGHEEFELARKNFHSWSIEYKKNLKLLILCLLATIAESEGN